MSRQSYAAGRQGGGSSRLSFKPQSSLADSFNSKLSLNNNSSNRQTMSRRSSAFNGRPSSTSYATTNITKEPRPIREKQWQTGAIKTLINFLIQAGYNLPVSPKTLQAPSSKDYQNIFRFLYNQLDPNYNYVKKFEEEVPVILRGLKYPFADQISKTHLYSVGSPHTWPNLLAVLTWMVELILCCDQLDRIDDLDDTNDTKHAEKIFFGYLIKTYSLFMEDIDEFPELDAELMSNFDRKNEQVLSAVTQISKQNTALEKEWETLQKSKAPLVLAQTENQLMLTDKKKYRDYITHIERKKAKAAEVMEGVKEEIGLKEAELAKMLEEKKTLTHTVDSQEISPSDVDRMNAERDHLQKSIDALVGKQEEMSKNVWEKEVESGKSLDKLDKTLTTFNDLSYKLGLQDPSSETRYELHLNPHATKPEQMINLDLRNVVKPNLSRIRSKYKAQVHSTQDELIALKEQIERLGELCGEKRDETVELEREIGMLNAEYTGLKESIGQSVANSNSERERLETEISKMKMESSSKLVYSQQALQNKQLEHDTQTRAFDDQVESIYKLYYGAMEDYCSFSAHVREGLDELTNMSGFEYREVGGAGMVGESVVGESMGGMVGSEEY